MAPRTKKVAHKRSRQDRDTTPAPDVEFTDTTHQHRFERLSNLKFGQSRYICWETLDAIGLTDEVRGLVQVGGWERLLSIHDAVRRDITLEVLTTFSYSRERPDASFDTENVVRFRAFGVFHGMSLTQFAMTLGLYDQDFIDSPDYQELWTDFPPDVTPGQIYHDLCGDSHYVAGQSKGSSLTRHAHRYIHAILSRSITGRGDGTGALSRTDLLYLYSMTQGVPLHLGHVVADFFRHQSQYLRTGALFVGPYVTRLMFQMRLMLSVRGKERVSTPTPLGLVTLRLMGVVRRTASGGYALVESSSDDTESVGAPDAPSPPGPSVTPAAPISDSISTTFGLKFKKLLALV